MKRYSILFLVLYTNCLTIFANLSGTGVNYNGNRDQYCDNLVSNHGKRENYAPTFIPNDSTPIINVRINLIFIQKDDGSGNFQQNNVEHQTLLDDIISTLNEKCAWLTFPGINCFDGTEEEMVRDLHLRFHDHRYYVKKSSLWDNGLHETNYARLRPYYPNWYLKGVDDSLHSVIPDTLKGINVFFTEDSVIYTYYSGNPDPNDTINVWTGLSRIASSQRPDYGDWHRSSRIHYPCQFSKFLYMKNIVPLRPDYPSWENEVREWLVWGVAGGLLHELGHDFDLNHPNSGCFETIMNSDAGSPRNFLPPSEIGLMHFSSMTSNLQQFIPDSTYLGFKNIYTSITLPRMRMYYSLLVDSTGNVSIPCEVTFSAEGKIVVQRGGVLNIDGGNLESIQDMWGGIIVKSGGTLILSDVNIGDYNIVVESGGSLFVRNNLSITGNHSIYIKDGGYICIDDEASVNLMDEFSLFIIEPNAILGCSSCNDDCITIRSNLSNIGNGHFVTYEGTDYIQNTTITSEYFATGMSVYAGYDVTNTKPVGAVVVEDGGELRIKANETVLTKDVEVKLGGTLKIDK